MKKYSEFISEEDPRDSLPFGFKGRMPRRTPEMIVRDGPSRFPYGPSKRQVDDYFERQKAKEAEDEPKNAKKKDSKYKDNAAGKAAASLEGKAKETIGKAARSAFKWLRGQAAKAKEDQKRHSRYSK